MKAKLAAFLMTNQYGNYVGVVGVVIRTHVVSGPAFVLPAAYVTPCFDMQHAQSLLILLGDQMSEETCTEIKFYMDPLPQRTFSVLSLPMLQLEEIEKEQRARMWS